MSDEFLQRVILEIMQALNTWCDGFSLQVLGNGLEGIDFAQCMRYDLVQSMNRTVYSALLEQNQARSVSQAP